MSRLRRLLGFTQIEILVIVFIIGVMAAIAAPSFGGMLESARMKQAAVELRSAFQETQRQSIRASKTCDATVLIPAGFSQSSSIQGSCLSSGDRTLPKGIGIATNVEPSNVSVSKSGTLQPLPSPTAIHKASFLSDVYCYYFPSQCQNNSNDEKSSQSKEDLKVQIGFGRLGAANFNVVTASGTSSAYEHSAKFVSFRPSKQDGKKSCVVLSRSLGLTRIGRYQGTLNPTDITSSGKCQVASWTEQ